MWLCYLDSASKKIPETKSQQGFGYNGINIFLNFIMTNPKVEMDIVDLLNKLDSRFDKVDERFDKIDERLNKIEVGQAEIKGDIKAIDERLSGQIKALDTKVEQMNVRIGNVEFANRGILIGIGVVILGGVAMLFGLDKP